MKRSIPPVVYLLKCVLFSFIIGTILSQPSFAREKTVVMISIFQIDSDIKMDFTSKTRDEISTLLNRLHYFSVIQRSRMESLMSELKETQSQQLDQHVAMKFGQQLDAQLVILGTLDDIDYQIHPVTLTNDTDKNISAHEITSRVTLNIEILDVEHDFVMYTNFFTGTASRINQGKSSSTIKKDIISKAIHNAVAQLWTPIQEVFPIRGIVIRREKRSKNYCVYVDIGRNWGLEKGRMLSFFDRGEKLIHPVTGQTLNAGKGELFLESYAEELFAEYCITYVTRKYYKMLDVGVIVEVEPVPLPDIYSIDND